MLDSDAKPDGPKDLGVCLSQLVIRLDDPNSSLRYWDSLVDPEAENLANRAARMADSEALAS